LCDLLEFKGPFFRLNGGWDDSVRKTPRIILTAPATEMSNHYGKIFLGFGACISNPPFPPWFTKLLFYPEVKHINGEAYFAPYSLRKIEASLLKSGFKEEEIATIHPKMLEKTVTSETKVLGISVMDPLGLGPTSLTFASIFNGETATYREFKNLMKIVKNLRFKHKGLKVVVGGPGAWQIYETKTQDKFEISTLVLGEGEKIAPKIFWDAVNEETLPKIVFGEELDVGEIPTIKKPSVCGLVEISRGCGKNCQFCMPTLRGKRDIPIEKIVEEVKVNVKAGCPSICLHAEDALMYGSGAWNRFRPNKEKVLELFKSVLAELKKPRFGVSHVALSSIAADPKLVAEITELMQVGKSKYAPLFGYQTGIETGSVRLIGRYMAGKPLPFKPEEWPEVVVQAFGISKDYGWIPAATLIMGLPDETPSDVIASLELMDKLKDVPSFIIPQFFIPITETVLRGEKMFNVLSMRDEHWQLLNKCIEHSVRWAELLRTLYFKPDSLWLRVGYWFGYRALYFFGWVGGKQASKRLGLI
jgi:radical SAM superfamily enzyme YgiQ (UPF0313 family)